MFTDYVLNGEGFGPVGNAVTRQVRFEPNLNRPYVDAKGNQCVNLRTGGTKFNEELQRPVPVFQKVLVQDARNRGIDVVNAQTLVSKDAWLLLDQAIQSARRQRLRAWTDLAGANEYRLDGMGKTVLEGQRMTDSGEAMVDMDAVAEGTTDRPLHQLHGIPLPITHSGFTFSKRDLAVSRNSGAPLDTTQAEACARRVAETVEKTLIGVTTGFTYSPNASLYDNNPTVYGYTNHPDRITYTSVTTPTGVGTSQNTISNILAMRDAAYAQNFYGPFMLYHTNDWDQWLDNDYGVGTPGATAAFAPSQTLRQRIRQIEGIRDVRRLDFWTDTYALLLVQMTSDVVRAINGMDMTTLQWEGKGGLIVYFKVMAIHVPQIRSQHIGTDQTNAAAKCGIVHGTTS